MTDYYQQIKDEEEIRQSQRMAKIDHRQNQVIFILFLAIIVILAAIIYFSFLTL